MPEQFVRLQFMSNSGPAPLGTRTHSACVRGIGDFFVGEMVKLRLTGKETREATRDSPAVTFWHVLGKGGNAVMLSSEEWREVDDLCQYIMLDGSFCLNRPLPGQSYCPPHAEEMEAKSSPPESPSPLPSPRSKSKRSEG